MLRTLSGENTKSTISVDKTNEALLEHVSIKLNQEVGLKYRRGTFNVPN